MKRHSAFLLLLGLSACEAPSQAVAPGEEVGGTEAPTPAPAARWTLSDSAEGVTVELFRSGEPVARFACLTAGRTFQAQGFGLKPIASEERLTVGAGDEAHALVADPVAAVTAVLGSGAISPALLEAIEAGAPLSLSYGAQTLGPLETLSLADQAAFVTGCRAVLAN